MAVISRPLRASLRVTDGEDETIQSFHRFRHDINAVQAEMFLDGIALIRGFPVGNGFLTVINELAEVD